MQQGLCRPSKNPWVNPLHLVQKKNSDWYPCGDYCKFNKVTLPDHYSILARQHTFPAWQNRVLYGRSSACISTDSSSRISFENYNHYTVRTFPIWHELRNAAQTFQRWIYGSDRTWLLFYLFGIQISSVRFPKDGASCCEWFIADSWFWRFQRG